MKAMILNSGRGSRMNRLTEPVHKSMIKLSNSETIFERQLRILSDCGIKDFIITTGYRKEQLIEAGKKFASLNFIFVDNPLFESTNYIYSIFLADRHLDNDLLILHGDLVFNKRLITEMLAQDGSICLFNEELPLPAKDFKGRIRNGQLKEVSIDIFDSDCFAFQPLYKLSKKHIIAWKNEIRRFVLDGNVQVYAENALNILLDYMEVRTFSYREHYIDEIDTEDDLQRVSEAIRWFDYREQEVYFDCSYAETLPNILCNMSANKVLVVASHMFRDDISQVLRYSGISFVVFSGYSQNPKFEEVKEGLNLFLRENCDLIVSIGGGSCIDTAKCIKLFSKLDSELDFLDDKYIFSGVKHLAIPTTAGTGSESTRFSVVYYNNKKQSITHDSILPDFVLLDPSLLKTLPEYHKKSAMMDSLSQAIESYWSKSATSESREYSKKAIELVLDNYKDYLLGNEAACRNMLLASNFSGKAINISTTTAPHAMSYMLTSHYGISHGHAVGACLPYVWEYMYERTDHPDYNALLKTFSEVAGLLRCENVKSAIKWLKGFYHDMKLADDFRKSLDIPLLADSVNIVRLGNNPMVLSIDDIVDIYSRIKTNES